MKNRIEAVHDMLIQESRLREASEIGAPAQISNDSEKITGVYRITGKRRNIEKLEQIFKMINEASDNNKSSQITVELSLHLGGSEEWNEKLKISKVGGKKMGSSENGISIERKANVYI